MDKTRRNKSRDNMVKRSTKVLPPCVICDSSAAGIHYGVPTCESCKVCFYQNTNTDVIL